MHCKTKISETFLKGRERERQREREREREHHLWKGPQAKTVSI